ncbi:MAG: T9SS type A sorting domain-containing protein [Cyclobacteriaceae bacterium]
MKKLLFILIAGPCFSFGQGKFSGGDGSGFSSASITISSDGPVLGLIESRQLIYPNPATSFIHLEKMIMSPTGIVDIKGKMIKRITSSTKTIDVEDLTPGIYFLITSGKTHRFIKIPTSSR